MLAAAPLSDAEALQVVRAIKPRFREFVLLYDTKKYWPDVYEGVLRQFGQPVSVSPVAIRDALLWKYGHLGKPAIPPAHEVLISQVQAGWTLIARSLPPTPQEAFEALLSLSKPTPRPREPRRSPSRAVLQLPASTGPVISSPEIGGRGSISIFNASNRERRQGCLRWCSSQALDTFRSPSRPLSAWLSAEASQFDPLTGWNSLCPVCHSMNAVWPAKFLKVTIFSSVKCPLS